MIGCVVEGLNEDEGDDDSSMCVAKVDLYQAF